MCDTCGRLRQQLRDEAFALVKASSEREAFVPNAPWRPEDSKRNEEVRIAEEGAQKRFDEASARLSHHREAAHRAMETGMHELIGG